LGQHFLERRSILAKIAAVACPAKEELVVEIGGGKGALTEQLAERADRLVSIEVDPFLSGYLRQKFREQPRVHVIEADVLKTDLGQWGPAVIAGNLPYYITSPILERVFNTPGWRRAVFLVQKEVAARITSGPGSRDFGYLSVLAQVHARAELVFDVSRNAFRPPPKVDNAVIRLEPYEVQLADRVGFLKFAALCFKHKRKTLRNNLCEVYPRINELTEGKLRAEQLGIQELAEVYRKLAG
jgi:16S rRNA (adenine1518-N6/adenine1519-N6)-dimethyltransferase